MTDFQSIQLVGAVGSPYTRKMLALLRYRRIPHRMTWGQPEMELPALGLDVPKPVLLPTCILPDANGQLQAVTDSTPIIRRLHLVWLRKLPAWAETSADLCLRPYWML